MPPPTPHHSSGITANLLHYLEARSLLLSLETQEATQTILRVAILFVLGVIIAITAWILLTAGCTFLIINQTGWSPQKTLLIFGGAQALLALLLFLTALMRLKATHWFADTINELKNDRKWLATQTNNP